LKIGLTALRSGPSDLEERPAGLEVGGGKDTFSRLLPKAQRSSNKANEICAVLLKRSAHKGLRPLQCYSTGFVLASQ